MSIPTSTSLTLRALFKTAVGAVGLGSTAAPITGLTSAAKALVVAATAGVDDPVIAIVPSDADVDAMTADTRFFLASLQGVSGQGAQRLVLPFPSLEVDPYRGLSPHFEVASARGRALHAMLTGQPRVVVASAAALLPRLSPPARMLAASAELAAGNETSPTELGDLLGLAGFIREDPVDEHGEFCVRGGVVDFFPAGASQPVRVEFVGDVVESIRQYDPSTQRSVGALPGVAVVPVRERFDLDDGGRQTDLTASVFEFATHAGGVRLVVSEPDAVAEHLDSAFEQLNRNHEDAEARDEDVPALDTLIVSHTEIDRQLETALSLSELALDDAPTLTDRGDRTAGARVEYRSPNTVHVSCQPAVEFRGRLQEWIADIRRARERRESVLFVAATTGTAERTVELLADYELSAIPVDDADDGRPAAVLVAVGQLSRGFRLPDAALQIYAEADVFDEPRRVHERKRSLARTFLTDFRDLKAGDFVVHVDHGVGRFEGLRQLEVALEPQEFMELRYADEDKLFVPVEHLDHVQKYTGGSRPPLDRLGGTTWDRAKIRVRRAMRDMAEELLKLYAARKAIPGRPFSSDSHWQREFEDAFEYDLTADQQVAIDDIKRDMEAPVPMDRLLCGDVGYGKTEVALRGAFKAVMDGAQVAFLAPTTVLAFQHAQTLKDRFAAFPVRIEMLSRFKTKNEQKQILTDLGQGKVEVVVGTHRLLSKDVAFRDLGLLIVDEEQRFGVAHKERIKQMRRRIDVLSLTATPIPRTLNMSLAGIRDMSIIETPPKDRLAIQTYVIKFDSQVVARAIRSELERGGQVYVVHNRVESICAIGDLVGKLVPEARVAVVHGQMREAALERCMVDFVAHRFDVLVTTTIIENGLDIPNANTLIVNHADQFGLAQLYQLRGRIGRSDRRAYAYLLVPADDTLSAVARKRLAAIREFSDLGSGFRVAALDLEIRGAGNLLGGEQSGHIEAIGFEMYVKLLEETVRELNGEEIQEEFRAAVNLSVDLRIDREYIPDMNQRLTVYRRVAAARSEPELEQLLAELRDRYGPPSASVLNLAEYGRIRVKADELGVESIDREGSTVLMKFRASAEVDPARIVQFIQVRPDVSLVPPGLLKVDLHAPATSGVTARSGRTPPSDVRGMDRHIGGPVPDSWWTTRAATGAVAPGFTRKDMLRPRRDDPRGPTGVFSRISSLLADLSEAARIS